MPRVAPPRIDTSSIVRRTGSLVVAALLVFPSVSEAAFGWGQPVNLGPAVNSAGDEYGITVAPDNVTIYFDSDGHPGIGSKDIYTSTFDGVSWSPAQSIGFGVNTVLREYAPAISPDGQTLLFTSEGFNIHMATGGAGSWGSRQPLPGTVNTQAQEWGARFVDATHLTFSARERTGGTGSSTHDIFTAQLSLGNWVLPALHSLSTIQGDEYGAHVAADEDSMFLVKNGDIYMSKWNGAAWDPAIPIPGLVNTMEFYEASPVLSPDGQRLYFTSERSDGQGGYDIWYSEWTEIVAVGEVPSVSFELAHARPNPFNPRTTIRFELDRAVASARLSIYDVAGRELRRLVDGPASAGALEVVWDGRDDEGRALPSGTYLYRLQADGESLTRKMSLVR